MDLIIFHINLIEKQFYFKIGIPIAYVFNPHTFSGTADKYFACCSFEHKKLTRHHERQVTYTQIMGDKVI